VPWLYNNNPRARSKCRGTLFSTSHITGPQATPTARYFVVLVDRRGDDLVRLQSVRGRIGRMWMAVRDMDIAARAHGHPPADAKLMAFAVSSFYCGVAGAMIVFLWLRRGGAEAFNINESFLRAVHGHHRRPRLAHRFVLRRRAHHILPIVLRALPLVARPDDRLEDGRTSDLRWLSAR
jgi:branched-chain amino acid transport system permease protein